MEKAKVDTVCSEKGQSSVLTHHLETSFTGTLRDVTLCEALRWEELWDRTGTHQSLHSIISIETLLMCVELLIQYVDRVNITEAGVPQLRPRSKRP